MDTIAVRALPTLAIRSTSHHPLLPSELLTRFDTGERREPLKLLLVAGKTIPNF